LKQQNFVGQRVGASSGYAAANVHSDILFVTITSANLKRFSLVFISL